MHRFEKKNFLFCMHKMIEITKEIWEINAVEVKVFNDKKWLNRINIKDQLKHSNLAAVILKYSLKYRKQRQELQNNLPCRIFSKESLTMQIIIHCKRTPAVNFSTRLVFN